MATFTTANYQSLIKILGLRVEQIQSGSELRIKGDELEELDIKESTNFVGEVQQAISDYESAENDYNVNFESSDNNGISSVSVSGEYSMSFEGGAGYNSKYGNYTAAIRRHRDTITRLLNWDRTNPYSGSATKSVS